jgi:hypothetical protein
MIHKTIPDYVKEAARKGINCDVERLSSSNEGTVVTVISIPGKTALRYLSMEESKKPAIAKRIRAIGNTNEMPVQKVADASLLNDDALKIEFEKRFGKSPEPVEPTLEEKPKGKPGRKPKEILDESPSLLTDENESI